MRETTTSSKEKTIEGAARTITLLIGKNGNTFANGALKQPVQREIEERKLGNEPHPRG